MEKRISMNDVILTTDVKNVTQKKVKRKKKSKIRLPKNKVTAPLYKLAKYIRMKTKVYIFYQLILDVNSYIIFFETAFQFHDNNYWNFVYDNIWEFQI